MTPIERVKRDHTLFKTKLGVLETALTFGEEAQFVVREVSLALARQLREHSRRESQLALSATQALDRTTGWMLDQLAIDHAEERRLLQALRLFTAQPQWLAEDVKAVLTAFVATCRAHMATQETQLFPFFDEILEKPQMERSRISLMIGAARAPNEPSAAGLDGRSRRREEL